MGALIINKVLDKKITIKSMLLWSYYPWYNIHITTLKNVTFVFKILKELKEYLDATNPRILGIITWHAKNQFGSLIEALLNIMLMRLLLKLNRK